MKKNDEYYMNLAYKEALKAYKIDEIPVGAIIVDNSGKIIGKGYNKKEKKNNAIYHAEVDAIMKATKKINNWRLNNCCIYITLYPCNLCLEVIKASKIERIIYASDQNISQKRDEDIKIMKLDNKVIENNCSYIILKKFNELRINNK